MSKTATSASRNPAAVALPPAVHTARPASLLQRILKVLSIVASLRLTVVLFCFALVLVFCGTLAQKDAGIWTVVNTYFRSAYVWVPFQIFFAQATHVSGGFPFPGGWLIGGL